jgi:NAD(P)-dependent dehydrogenase (short-subunit alcohol dehydrogenase family)
VRDGTGELAVVLGATGGVGQALVARLRQDGRHGHVVALSRRQPDAWTNGPAQTWLAADLLDEASLAAAAARIADLGAPSRIIVATGLLSGDGLTPEKSMRALNADALTRLFQVNAIGPALAAKHLLPLAPREQAGVFAVLSARVGSIADNALGGWYGYRASKAALNMILRTAAIEHRRSHPLGVCVAIHPGAVETGLSAPFLSGAARGRGFAPPEAADHILRVLDGLGPEANGGFYAWDGTQIPW